MEGWECSGCKMQNLLQMQLITGLGMAAQEGGPDADVRRQVAVRAGRGVGTWEEAEMDSIVSHREALGEGFRGSWARHAQGQLRS